MINRRYFAVFIAILIVSFFEYMNLVVSFLRYSEIYLYWKVFFYVLANTILLFRLSRAKMILGSFFMAVGTSATTELIPYYLLRPNDAPLLFRLETEPNLEAIINVLANGDLTRVAILIVIYIIVGGALRLLPSHPR